VCGRIWENAKNANPRKTGRNAGRNAASTSKHTRRTHTLHNTTYLVHARQPLSLCDHIVRDWTVYNNNLFSVARVAHGTQLASVRRQTPPRIGGQRTTTTDRRRGVRSVRSRVGAAEPRLIRPDRDPTTTTTLWVCAALPWQTTATVTQQQEAAAAAAAAREPPRPRRRCVLRH
jgi:hypothetical protein